MFSHTLKLEGLAIYCMRKFFKGWWTLPLFFAPNSATPHPYWATPHPHWATPHPICTLNELHRTVSELRRILTEPRRTLTEQRRTLIERRRTLTELRHTLVNLCRQIPSGSGPLCSVVFVRIRFWIRSWIWIRILPSSSISILKNLYFYSFVTFYAFFFEEWCKCTSKK